MLTLITFLTISTSWFLMDGPQLKTFGLTVLTISGFVSNIMFWQNSHYFAAPVDLLPMLHTWSLAIEEQFYIVFPVFLIICWKYVKKYLLSIIILTLIGSLMLSHWSSQNYRAPAAAFYLLPTRGWELLAGVALAKVELETGRPSHKILDTLMPAFGMFLILYGMFTFDKYTQHPSLYTIIPILGTILIIWFCKQGELVSDILASRIFVGIGLISYSLYLWHVPILAFSRLSNIGHLPSNINLWFFPLLFILSIVTWKYVELPFRNVEVFCKGKFILYMSLSWSLIIILGCFFYYHKGFPERYDFPDSLEPSFINYVGVDKCLDTNLELNNEDFFCELNNNLKNQHIDFILTGDSHAGAAIPAFKKFGELNNLRGIAATRGSCQPLLGIDSVTHVATVKNDCSLLSEKVYKFAQNNNVKYVFFISSWIQYIEHREIIDIESGVEPNNKSERLVLMARGLERTINKYGNIGTKIILLGSVPIQNYSAREIYKQTYLAPEVFRIGVLDGLHVKLSDHNKRQQEYTDIFNSQKSNYFYYLDLTPYYCDGIKCHVGTIDKSFYIDTNHISVTGTNSTYKALNKNKGLILTNN
jgi:hypothetical protein